MKAEYINPFITATVNVFETMLNCPLTRTDLAIDESHAPALDITGIIGLTGRAKGTVALSLHREVSFAATAAMTMEAAPTSIGDEVVDTVGELANMIAGSAKSKLEKYDLLITLPTVLVGRTSILTFPKNSFPISIGFDSAWGPIMVQVGIVECEPALV